MQDALSEQGQLELEARIALLEQRLTELTPELDQRAEWTFGADEDWAWWHRELERLIAGLEALESDLLAADAVTPMHGWSVTRRLDFARSLEAELKSGGRWRAAWDAHLPGLRADFPGLDEIPALVPLGRDPRSNLWEFAHLPSGAPAERDSEGALVLNEDTGVVLILVPGGEDWLGAQGEDPGGINYDPATEADEGPPFRAVLDPYLLAKYEFTQGQWWHATHTEPSFYKDLSFANDLRHPVEQVSWTECVVVSERLGLRLPDEYEWEFACRAGTDTPWSFGAKFEDAVVPSGTGGLDRLLVNVADATAADAGATWQSIEKAASFWDGSVVHGQVGSYPPNPFGFHEMHGNLFEWCANDPTFGPPGPERRADPIAPVNAATHRISRGGGFRFGGFRTRSSYRFDSPMEFRAYILGFRAAMDF